MKIVSKTGVWLLVFSVLVLDMLPVLAVVDFSELIGDGDFGLKETAAAFDLPLVTLPETDWATVNWDDSVVLPQDYSALAEQRMSLIDAGKEKEAAKLELKRTKLSDSEAMKHFGVPAEIQLAVRDYTKAVKSDLKLKNIAKQNLDKVIEQIVGKKVIVPEDKVEVKEEGLILDASKFIGTLKDAKIVEDEKVKNIKIQKKIDFVSPSSFAPIDYSLEALGARSKIEGPKTLYSKPLQKVSVWDKLKAVFVGEAVYADDDVIESYYDGIGDHAGDFLYYYVSNDQNENGSFGDNNTYEISANVFFSLVQSRRTESTQFQLLANYLVNTVAQDNREKALKVRVLATLNQPYQDLLDELIANQNPDNGGLALQNGFRSDLDTTLEYAMAMTVTGYTEDEPAMAGALIFIANQIEDDGEIHFTDDHNDSNASYYLMNKTVQYLYPWTDCVIVFDDNSSLIMINKINALLGNLESLYDEETQTLLFAEEIDTIMTLYTFDLYKDLYEVEDFLRSGFREHALGLQRGDGSFGEWFTNVMALKAVPQSDIVISDVRGVNPLVNKQSATLAFTLKNPGYKRTGDATVYVFIDNINTGISLSLSEEMHGIDPKGTINIEFAIPDTVTYVGDTQFTFYIENENDFGYKNNFAESILNFAAAADGTAGLPIYAFAQQYVLGDAPAIHFHVRHREDPNRSRYIMAIKPEGQQDWNLYDIGNDQPLPFYAGPFSEGINYQVAVGVENVIGGITLLTGTQYVTTLRATASETLYRGQVSGIATDLNLPVSGLDLWAYSGGNEISGENGEFTFEVPNGNNLFSSQTDYYQRLWTPVVVPVDGDVSGVRVFNRLYSDIENPVPQGLSIQSLQNGRIHNLQDASVFGNASDNIDLKEADLYYYDPDEQLWVYEGTYEANGDQVLVDWYLGNLTGEGYQVKMVYRDWQGNSAEETFGPFIIFNGAPPEFTIVSPNGGEQFSLGEDVEILWSVETANGLSDIELFASYVGGALEYINLDAPDTGTYTWTIPNGSALASESVKIFIRGEDALNSEQGEDYSDDYFEIVDNSPQPDAPWGNVETVTNVTERLPIGGSIQGDTVFLEDSAGVLHMVYRFVHDQLGNPRIITQKLYQRTYSNGNWSLPEEIYVEVTQTDGNLTGYNPIARLQGIIDNQDNFHLAWLTKNGGGCEVFNQHEIYYMVFDGNSWSVPENISNNSTHSKQPSLAVDTQGQVYVAWLDGQTWDEQCGRTGGDNIYHIKKTGNSWSTVGNYAPDQFTGSPYLAATDDGIVHMIHGMGSLESMGHSVYSGNDWIYQGEFFNGYGDYVQVKSVPDGKLVYTSRYYTDRAMIVASSYDGQSWEPVEVVSPLDDTVRPQHPNIAVDSDGNINVLYEQTKIDGGQRELMWTTRLAQNQWRTPQRVSRETQYLTEDSAQIVFQDPATLSAIWVNYYGLTTEIHFNQADISPTFNSISLDEPSIISNGQDVQTATFRVDNGQLVDKVLFYCNHNWHRPDDEAPVCGYFQWTPEGGFEEVGVGYNNDKVNLIVDGPDASQRLFNSDGSVDFVVRFTVDPQWGGYDNNSFSAISYFNGSAILTWRAAPGGFDIIPDDNYVAPPVFNSLTLVTSTILANSEDIQTAILKFDSGEGVDEVRWICNYANHRPDVDAPYCGYFQWTEELGFKEFGGGFNNAKVELITQGENASERVVNEDGSVDFVARFTVDPSWGGYQNNSVSAIGFMDGRQVISWKVADSRFDILEDPDYVPPPSLVSFGIEKNQIIMDDTDVQSATFVLDYGDQVDHAYIQVNRPGHSANPARGLFRWLKSTGQFQEIGGLTYGNQFVTLLTDQSSVEVNEEAGQVTITFRWTVNDTHAEIADNLVSYLWADTDLSISSGWKNSGEVYSTVVE